LSPAYALTPPTARRPASCHAGAGPSGASSKRASLPERVPRTGLLGAGLLLAARCLHGDEQCPGRDGCRRARALGAGGVERAV